MDNKFKTFGRMKEFFRPNISTKYKVAEKSDPRLHTNPVLQELVLELSTAKPSHVEIKKIAQKCGLTEEILEQDKNNGKNRCGKLAEFHTFYVLSSLTKFLPGINLSPIPDKTSTEAFTFEQNGINYQIRNNKKGLHVIEYDILSEINSLPVIWEIKLNGTVRPIGNERIDKIITPLQEYYASSKFGYVLVRPCTSINKTFSQMKKIEQQFIGRGGIIVHFPCTKAEFKKEAYGEKN